MVVLLHDEVVRDVAVLALVGLRVVAAEPLILAVGVLADKVVVLVATNRATVEGPGSELAVGARLPLLGLRSRLLRGGLLGLRGRGSGRMTPATMHKANGIKPGAGFETSGLHLKQGLTGKS